MLYEVVDRVKISRTAGNFGICSAGNFGVCSACTYEPTVSLTAKNLEMLCVALFTQPLQKRKHAIFRHIFNKIFQSHFSINEMHFSTCFMCV